MKRKIAITLMMVCLAVGVVLAQKKNNSQESGHAFKINEHVLVTMPDGKQVEAIIHGHVSKKKYYVRQVGSNKQGKVHEKFIKSLEGTIPKTEESKK
ncbi:hypothetical protein [Reichenbachiella versicolor]|uniref:hypothetical protein n=1 Tax=Reichenbachiella versicolor TaxID=1821036 RepID=UPI000D6E548B|nr:hypothetical protein [Reichenbachiella versicolor]